MSYERLEKEVRERIARLQEEKNFSENGLAGGDAPAQKRINRQLSHGAAVTLDTLLRLLSTYPDVSVEWLLRGSGDMYISHAGAIGANKVTGRNATVIGQQTTGDDVSYLKSIIAEKDKQIDRLFKLLEK